MTDMTDMTDLQKRILLAAFAKPAEPIHCNQLLGGRWSVLAGGTLIFFGNYLNIRSRDR